MSEAFENNAPRVEIEMVDDGSVEIKTNTSGLGAIMLLASAIESIAAGEAKTLQASEEAVKQ
jgi:hypothetical protein